MTSRFLTCAGKMSKHEADKSESKFIKAWGGEAKEGPVETGSGVN